MQPKFLNEETIEGKRGKPKSGAVGILERDKMRDDEKYPLIKGKAS